jgi:xanthine dehydrogenase accessory factor
MRREILEQILADRAAERAVVLVTELASGAQRILRVDGDRPADVDAELWSAAEAALRADRSTTIERPGGAGGPVFLHVFNSPLKLVVVGAVHVTQALAPMAALAGFRVIVVDPRRAFATSERFPDVTLMPIWPGPAFEQIELDRRSAVVTLTHDPKLDDPALASALRSRAYYVGALGSKKTHAARCGRLAEMGFSDEQIGRIKGPVGMDIGARNPNEIAVSILADVIAALRREPS